MSNIQKYVEEGLILNKWIEKIIISMYKIEQKYLFLIILLLRFILKWNK